MRLIAFALIGLLQAQSPSSTSFHFEVASVKPNLQGNVGVTGNCYGVEGAFGVLNSARAIPRARCVITAARLSHLIGIAYNLQMDRIKGGPDWIMSGERYDVSAKAADDSASSKQLVDMLRNLMADRFRLKFHFESKDVDGHAVMLAKSGLKLKESTNGQKRASMKILGAGINKFDAVDGKNTNLNTIVAEGMTISEFVDTIALLPGFGPLVDKTGLKGTYDIKLSWEPGESLNTVFQEQLGLRLEGQKVPVDYFMIDSAERPSEN
jgi:bla regulator protein blaR1